MIDSSAPLEPSGKMSRPAPDPGEADQAPRRTARFAWIGVAVVTALIAFILFLWLYPMLQGYPLLELRDRLGQLSTPALEKEKLIREILQLELDNRSRSSLWGLFASYSPLLAALVAGLGLLATVWKQISERSRQLEEDRRERQAESNRRAEQQEQDRRQREAESKRRFDENFNKVVENLGSQSAALQVSAAVSLATFLKAEYREFHDQVHMVVLANLKIGHDATVLRPLVRVFEQSVRIRLGQGVDEEERRYLLDLSGAHLYRVDLSGQNLEGADLAHARLTHANLSDCNLFRVQGILANLEKARLSRSNLSEARLREAVCPRAHFHGTNLISARLEDADLKEAQFQEAQLQSAHLDGARILSARFERADLNDAFFRGTHFDEATLGSIARGAQNWRKAHFDAPVRERLEQMSGT